MLPLPSYVQSIALSFTKGDPPTQLSHTQSIPLESMQFRTNTSNSVKIDPTFVGAFNNEPMGTIFTPSIVINYGNNITTATSPASGVPNFVPRPPPISLAANGLTIQYTPPVGYTPPSFPFFVQANPRGTGTEWFAVVNNNAHTYINLYARDQQIGKNYFTTSGQLVPFNNIVTTLMTGMDNLLSYSGNPDVTSFDTSGVINFTRMFIGTSFNRNINHWNVSSGEDFEEMFIGTSFNQPLNNWNVGKAKDLKGMFLYNYTFNQNLSAWRFDNFNSMRFLPLLEFYYNGFQNNALLPDQMKPLQ
jgi:hypothetical protein